MAVRFEHQWNDGKGRIRRISTSLESRVQSADMAESIVMEFCARIAGELICEQVGLAVRESVANAVVHGNRLDLNKKVQLTAELNDTGLIVCIKDEGDGFDPDSLPDPLLPDQLLNESGRGLFIVKSCMDNVIMRRCETRGMEITLVKRITAAPLKRTRW